MDIDEELVYTALRELHYNYADDLRPGYVEIRGILPSGHIGSRFFSQEGGELPKAVEAARDMNTHGNVWIGRATRARIGGSAEDIDRIEWISFDFDVIRPAGTIASVDDLKLTREAAARLQIAANTKGYVVMTGNGHQVWIRLSDSVDVRARRQAVSRAIKVFTDRCISKMILPDRVQVDPQHDLPRVIKLPGTWSRKGVETGDETRKYRMAHFEEALRYPGIMPDTLDSDYILEEADKPPLVATLTQLRAAVMPTRFWADMEKDPKLREAWMGVRQDLPSGRSSQSEQDMALVSRLRTRGYSREEVKGILMMSPVSKAGGREDYCDATIRKVFGG